MKRYEKTRILHYKMRKDTVYIDNRLFYLSWKKHCCCNLKSVGRTNKSKVGLKPFNNEYQDGVLNLTDEKTPRGKTRKEWKDTERHEKTRTLHYRMRKDRIHIDKICFI